MSEVWNAQTYDSERRRLVPCFDQFYGCAVDLVACSVASNPRVLDLGAGTGLLSQAITARVGVGRFTLIDISSDMLQRARDRLSALEPEIVVQPLTAELPRGPFDAVVSALAIHHSSDDEKRSLYRRIYSTLGPGGIFVNAEQVLGKTPRLEALFEQTHLDRARALGSSDDEIRRALERMQADRCAPLDRQLGWLERAGYRDVDCFFRSFRFAVFAGWKASQPKRR